jgi:hypothetical protein
MEYDKIPYEKPAYDKEDEIHNTMPEEKCGEYPKQRAFQSRSLYLVSWRLGVETVSWNRVSLTSRLGLSGCVSIPWLINTRYFDTEMTKWNPL